MEKGIFISIKPQFTKRIESKEKNYEFRNYIPKADFELLYVYETVPSCLLKYIIKVDKIIKYPDKIIEDGYGNNDFNNGLKTEYAYHIAELKKFKNPIPLKELKSKFNFCAPQSYSYDKRYPELVKYISEATFEKII